MKRLLRGLGAAALGALLASACSSDDATAERAAEASAESEDESAYLFDQDELRTFELTLAPEDLATLDADPAAEQYVDGTLTFEGQTMPVGVRYKGQIGSFLGCTESSAGVDFTDPAAFEDIIKYIDASGAKTCQKLSVKVKINWVDPDVELYDQRRLQFHAMNTDATQLHDRLGYWLYNEMGVSAPRAVHARLVINGEYSGLYSLVEEVDGRFTRREFADGTGNLYKTMWPLTTAGQPQAPSAFRGALETNEDENASVELMSRFAEEIATATPADAKEVIDRWMDIDAVLAQLAVERTIHHDDSPSNWLCFTEDFCNLNNFYWYIDPSDEQAWLIPWDIDAAFLGIRPEKRIPLIAVPDDFGEITDDCELFDVGSAIFRKRSAACDPIYAAWAQFEVEYEDALRRFLEGPFSEEVVDAQLDAWTEQIEAATEEAARAHDDALTVAEWRAAVDELRSDLDYARSHCRICDEPYG